MGTASSQQPPARAGRALYSNFDHVLDQDVAAELEASPGALCAQHAAWDFCGYVWTSPDGQWHEQVWRYGAPVAVLEGASAAEVVALAVERYGAN